MTTEFDVRCFSQMQENEFAIKCPDILCNYFGVTDRPKIDICKPDQKIEIRIKPFAEINIVFYGVHDDLQSKMFAGISMLHDPQSLLLGTVASVAIAQANSTFIKDEKRLLGMGRLIQLESLKSDFHCNTFAEVAELFAKKAGVFQKG